MPMGAYAVAVQSDDNIIAAGYSNTNNSAIGRYIGNDISDYYAGSFDFSFANMGFNYNPICSIPYLNPGAVFSYDTTTQVVAAANTPTNITFNTDINLMGWTHTSGNAPFTCQLSGEYSVSYVITAFDTAPSPASTVSAICLLDDVQLAGSQSAINIVMQNQPYVITRSFTIRARTGDQLKLQLIGTAATNQIAGLGYGADKPSVSITILPQ